MVFSNAATWAMHACVLLTCRPYATTEWWGRIHVFVPAFVGSEPETSLPSLSSKPSLPFPSPDIPGGAPDCNILLHPSMIRGVATLAILASTKVCLKKFVGFRVAAVKQSRHTTKQSRPDSGLGLNHFQCESLQIQSSCPPPHSPAARDYVAPPPRGPPQGPTGVPRSEETAHP